MYVKFRFTMQYVGVLKRQLQSYCGVGRFGLQQWGAFGGVSLWLDTATPLAGEQYRVWSYIWLPVALPSISPRDAITAERSCNNTLQPSQPQYIAASPSVRLSSS